MLDKTTREVRVTKPKPRGIPIQRDSQGLRDALFDEIDGIRDGTGHVQSAIVIANLAKQTINIVKAELEFRRLVSSGAVDDKTFDKPIQLGKAR